MSDGTLSQDEIDALLQGTDEMMTENLGNTPGGGGFAGGKSVAADALSDNDKANLGELLREIGQAQATAISTLTGINAAFSSPFIDAGQLDNLKKDIKGRLIQAKVSLTGGVTGELVYVVPEKSVLTITNILIGQEDNNEITDLVKNTFGEVISQTTGALVNILSERLSKSITPGAPNLELLQDASGITPSGGQYFVRLNYVFSLQNKGNSKFYVFLALPMARSIAGAYSVTKASMATQFGGGVQQPQTGIPIRTVGFEPLQVGVASEAMGNIALLLDVPMRVTVDSGVQK